MNGDTLFSILCRVFKAGKERMSPAIAQALLEIHFSDVDQARVQELGDKCNRGTISADEITEYDAYIGAADMLSIWHSMAHAALKKSSATEGGL